MSEADPRHAGPIRRLAAAMVSPNSYGSVLVLILVTYVLSVALSQPWTRSLVLVVQIGAVLLALHVSGARRPIRMLAAAVFVVAAVIAIVDTTSGRDEFASWAVFLTSALLYFIAPLSILRAIVVQREVTLEIVLGAIDAYLLIGIFFAFAFQALGAIGSAPFFEGGIDGTVSDSLFFSFTTLTTTGYGNLVPAAKPGQTFAVMEMLIGQLFLITAVAKVINAWRPVRWRATEDGLTDEQADEPTDEQTDEQEGSESR
ncbi:MAG: ion channel [Actinomycetota bacterium]